MTHILVFDSGLGGTTILSAVQKQLPENRYSYAMDNAAFPYGDKPDALLLARSIALFEQLLPLAQPDLVIIACNTASTLILETLRARFAVPFVGVVPAIKPAAEQSRSKVIGLLATPATIKREYIDQLTTAYAHNCRLIRYGHPELVTLAEQKMLGQAVKTEDLATILAPMKQQKGAEDIDTMVLGCTHYPALRDELAQAWGSSIDWIDSGEAIARRVADLTGAGKKPAAQAAGQSATDTLAHPACGPGQTGTLYLTAADASGRLLKCIEKYSIDNCTIVAIDGHL